MTKANINSIDDVVGHGLDAVCFVADYVELRFGGAALRFLLYPVEIRTDSEAASFPETGSCDLLRQLIGMTASKVSVSQGSLTVHLGGSAAVRGRIDESDLRGPESIQFVPWENGRLNAAAMETW
jgi:hypothetical protein